MWMGGQGTKCRRNIAEHFYRLKQSSVQTLQTTDKQTTDGQATAYREREFTFAEKWW